MDGRSRGTVTEGTVGGWYANPAFLIGERIAQPKDRDRIFGALRLAAELAGAPKASRRNWGGVDYHFGVEAYEQWARALLESCFWRR